MPGQTILPIYVRASSDQIIKRRFKAFTDSISDLSGVENTCGTLTYDVFDERGERRRLQAGDSISDELAPTIEELKVDVLYYEKAKTFLLEIDTSNYSTAGVRTF